MERVIGDQARKLFLNVHVFFLKNRSNQSGIDEQISASLLALYVHFQICIILFTLVMSRTLLNGQAIYFAL